LFLFNWIDTLYYPFSKKRSGIDFFSLIIDDSNPIFSYILDYWWSFVVFGLLVFSLYKTMPRISVRIFKPRIQEWFLLIIWIPTLILGLRGGVGLKPLKSADASKWVSPGLESTTLNTVFQIFSSLESSKPDFDFLNTLTVSDTSFISFNKHYSVDSLEKKPNIVVIILESFGRDYIGFLNSKRKKNSPTPFLDSLSKNSLTFVNAYANGSKSIDALPSIYASLPNLLEESFIYSWYQANKVNGIHYYLSQLGYSNSFYHGAKHGTMGFESFLKKTGPIDYFGLEDYVNKEKHFDGSWGIFDHHYLPYFASEFSKKQEPFFSSVFTLSSHHPYAIPKDLQYKFKSQDSELLNSIAYTDYSLGLFFETVSRNPSFKNTVFIMVGDHTSHSDEHYFYTEEGSLEIFLMLFDARGKTRKGVEYKTVDQLDIMPTVLSLAGYHKPYFSLGESLFNARSKGSISYRDGIYQFIQDRSILRLNKQGKMTYKISKKEFIPENILIPNKEENKGKMENKIYWLLKEYETRMSENKFY